MALDAEISVMFVVNLEKTSTETVEVSDIENQNLPYVLISI